MKQNHETLPSSQSFKASLCLDMYYITLNLCRPGKGLPHKTEVLLPLFPAHTYVYIYTISTSTILTPQFYAYKSLLLQAACLDWQVSLLHAPVSTCISLVSALVKLCGIRSLTTGPLI